MNFKNILIAFSLIILTTAQLFCQKKSIERDLYFVGHAYGNHKKKDQTINPELKKFINHNKNISIVWGGDFIQKCNDSIEILNFKNTTSKLDNKYVLGNHDNCTMVKEKILFPKKPNSFESIGKNLLLYLDANFTDKNDVDKTLAFALGLIESEKHENIFIFTHQVIFSTSQIVLLTNSRNSYELPNIFYKRLKEIMVDSEKKFHLFSGDIGAFNYMPYAFYERENNIYKYAVGLGNNSNYKILKISLNDSIKIKFLDLLTNKEEDLLKYNGNTIRLTYLPRLVQLFAKENLIITSIIFGALFFSIIGYRLWLKKDVAKK